MAPPSPANQSPYPSTGTDFYKTGTTENVTKTSLSTMIVIKVNDNPVGAIKSINITESREIGMIDEVGTDGHIDSAPKRSSSISGSCDRVRFDRMRVTEAFSRGFLHVRAQRVPFDIQIIDLMGGVDNAITTIIKNVWIKQLSYTYSADDWIISDKMDWEAETIYSTLGSGSSAAQQGLRQLQGVPWDVYEIAADVGKRRGAMDAPDIINAPLST